MIKIILIALIIGSSALAQDSTAMNALRHYADELSKSLDAISRAQPVKLSWNPDTSGFTDQYMIFYIQGEDTSLFESMFHFKDGATYEQVSSWWIESSLYDSCYIACKRLPVKTFVRLGIIGIRSDGSKTPLRCIPKVIEVRENNILGSVKIKNDISNRIMPLSFDGYGYDEVKGKSLDNNGFNLSGTENICTNYGYNFDINKVSLFYYFKDKINDKLIITYPGDLDFSGFSFCSLSGLSNDTLSVEGYKGELKEYQSKRLYDNQWTDWQLSFYDIDKIIIRVIEVPNSGIADFNFDKFLFYTR